MSPVESAKDGRELGTVRKSLSTSLADLSLEKDASTKVIQKRGEGIKKSYLSSLRFPWTGTGRPLPLTLPPRQPRRRRRPGRVRGRRRLHVGEHRGPGEVYAPKEERGAAGGDQQVAAQVERGPEHGGDMHEGRGKKTTVWPVHATNYVYF